VRLTTRSCHRLFLAPTRRRWCTARGFGSAQIHCCHRVCHNQMLFRPFSCLFYWLFSFSFFVHVYVYGTPWKFSEVRFNHCHLNCTDVYTHHTNNYFHTSDCKRSIRQNAKAAPTTSESRSNHKEQRHQRRCAGCSLVPLLRAPVQPAGCR